VSNTFATEYADGKWQLITTQLDSAGFVRPQHEDYPEEFIPTKVKETLIMTVITEEDADNKYAYRVFYDNKGHAEYKRLPAVCQTTLSTEVNSRSKEINVANADVLYDRVAVVDSSNVVVGNIEALASGPVSDTNPGYIWIDQELIEYREVDGNTLRKIRRGVSGTSIHDHASGTDVHSASSQHDIPNAEQSADWSAFDSSGTELADSTNYDMSEQAVFIRAGGISNY